MQIDPIHQFQVQNLVPLGEIGGYHFAFTNSALFMFAIIASVALFILFATRKKSMVPSRTQSLAEIWYEFVEGIVTSSTGREGLVFFPLIFSLFSFVLLSNLLGMMPYFFTVTSQIIVTAALSILVILTVVIAGFYKNGFKFLKLFVPSGLPIVLAPFIVLIEVISFLSRPLSLSLRLFANMLGGHIVLKVFAFFVVILSSFGWLGFLGAAAPAIVGVALTALEFLIAFLQAFVFALLASIYLNDALHPAH
ncbi:MAG: F0F1 ATP synthase subunit A [Pseudomonadota bacterium]